MPFHDVKLPKVYRYGSVTGPKFVTLIQDTASGHEHRGQRQAQARHQLRLSRNLESPSEAAAIKEFALARRGSYYGFRVEDLADYTTAADDTSAPADTDVNLAVGDGSRVSWQLVKIYDASGPAPYPRSVTLPQASTVVARVADVAKTEGVDFSVTNPGGVITFDTPPGAGDPITVGFKFDIPVRFAAPFEAWAAARADAFELWSHVDLEVIEILNEVEWPELWFPGHGKHRAAQSVDFSISFGEGSLHTVETAASVNCYLPTVPTLFPGGDRVFTIVNTGLFNLQARDDQGNTVGSAFGASQARQIACQVASGNVTWHLY